MKTRKLVYIIIWAFCISSMAWAQYDSISVYEKDWELFPILNYDTDVGFGYGAKAFFYNFLEAEESFDLTIYNSTKGERWYRIVFSIPDIQRRQGKKYDAAFDLIVDYDKWINYIHYYNTNSSSVNRDKDFEEYVREPLEITGLFSRAFTTDIIAELGLTFKSISCYNFAEQGLLKDEKPSTVQHLSLLISLRYDTRTNFINPKKGLLLEVSNELAKDVLDQEQSFFKFGLTFQFYKQIYTPNLVFASRIMLQSVTDVSYQNMLPIGGNNSIRGLPQSRYLSNSFILLNEEIRYPIWGRLNGIVGLDLGKTEYKSIWIINPVLGLRFNMDNFIVRADVGLGENETGFYFNFGHLF